MINNDSHEVESTIDITPDEAEMPGYVDHVIRGYEGTQWHAVRAPDTSTESTAGTADASADRGQDEAAPTTGGSPAMGYPESGGTTFANLVLSDWESAMDTFFRAVERRQVACNLTSQQVADALFRGYGDEVSDAWNEWCQ